MARTLWDRDLSRWEVFATTAPGGYPEPGCLVFHRPSESEQPPLYVEIDGDKPMAEKMLETVTDPELLALLAEAGPIQ